jgi:hypothetical protein
MPMLKIWVVNLNAQRVKNYFEKQYKKMHPVKGATLQKKFEGLLHKLKA